MTGAGSPRRTSPPVNRTFRARVLGDTTGAGTADVDEEFAARYFEGIGAEVMGAAMFGFIHMQMTPSGKGGGVTSRRSAFLSSC